MQLMTWPIARLGSRFGLLFEPYRGRVMHSALGRFYDQPLDLMAGLVEPDGTELTLPFTRQARPLYHGEQFERMNSITFRGFSERYGLCFELNVHAPFYPRDEALSTMPAFYLEMRLNPVNRVRLLRPSGSTPQKVRVFLRLDRPGTQIVAAPRSRGVDGPVGACLELTYDELLVPRADRPPALGPLPADGRRVAVRERIESLNLDAEPDSTGRGLRLELPVTPAGSGVKWRLVWGAYCADPVATVKGWDGERPAKLRYTQRYTSLDEVMRDAVAKRDERLSHSRRFEKVFDQAPLRMSQRHLLHQSFQSFLSNTFWCQLTDAQGQAVSGESGQWFTDMEGSSLYQSTLDVEYNVSLAYLTLWPELLGLQLKQWPLHAREHRPSGGSILPHDLGQGTRMTGPAFPYDMPVEENCNFLLLLQAHAHWTGDLSIVRRHGELIDRAARYLAWTDRDASGFPSEGAANTLDDAGPAVHFARKQTYLAVKRLAALRAAADLLWHLDRREDAARYDQLVEADGPKVERAAWMGDHYAVCVDRSAAGLTDTATGAPLFAEEVPGWDGYSIYSGNGLLLPTLIGQPLPIGRDHLLSDINSARMETLGPYGCGHSSQDPENVWISQNLWRDHLGRYIGVERQPLSERYWDLQVVSNVGDQSLSYVDSYIHNQLAFGPRGAASFGYLLCQPRLVVDRLAAGGQRLSVEPDRHLPQRWPLLPLADWEAGKIPVCVVDDHGDAVIENEIDPVIIHGNESVDSDMIG